MKTYPIIKEFDQTKVIGELRLLDDIEISSNSIFTPAGKILKSHKEKDKNGKDILVIDDFELMEISLILDRNRQKYPKFKKLLRNKK